MRTKVVPDRRWWIRVVSFFCWMFVANAAAFPAAPGKPQTVILTHATLFHPSTEQWQKNCTVVMREGRIEAVFHSDSRAHPEDARVIDCTGRYVIPGLIDAHVHVATDPSGEDNRKQVLKDLAEILREGITFVRDMGGDARVLAELQRGALTGELAIPDFRYSALMAGPGFMSDDRNLMATRGVTAGQVPWNLGVTTSTDLVLAVAEGRGCGASAIKVYAQIDPPLLSRIVAEAHRQKMAVWSHATVDPSKPGDAVEAGVDVISHADLLVWEAMPEVNRGPKGLPWRWLDEDVRSIPVDHPAILSLLRRMKEKGIIFDPTVYISRLMQKTAQEQYPQLKPVADHRARFAFAVTRLAHDMGVTVCSGTDAIIDRGMSPLASIYRELQVLVEECGFSPAAALRAATLNGACALGIQQTHGSIAPGKAADLVVLAADPTLDIANCQAVVGVIKAGRVIRLD